MHYKSFGSGDDIVFLHGWGGDISSFLFIAKQLSRSYKVTLLDFPAFGDSAEPETPFTVSDYAECVVQLLDDLKIDCATIVGHSFGGRVAMELAMFYPKRVSALVLIDSAGLKPRRKLSYYLRLILHKSLKKCGCAGLKGSADFQKLSPTMKETFKNIVNYDQTPLLKDIAQQTAIFWGKEDTETPPYMAKKLRRHIVHSEIFWLDGGHFAYISDSAKFYAILCAFLHTMKIEEKAENKLVQP
ncbi:MAG: alpha/beta hydrolase [Clostridia bacterium]